jgi:hypothetical protein
MKEAELEEFRKSISDHDSQYQKQLLQSCAAAEMECKLEPKQAEDDTAMIANPANESGLEVENMAARCIALRKDFDRQIEKISELREMLITATRLAEKYRQAFSALQDKVRTTADACETNDKEVLHLHEQLRFKDELAAKQSRESSACRCELKEKEDCPRAQNRIVSELED